MNRIKNLMLASALVLLSSSLFAQKGFQKVINAGVDIAMPLGNFSNAYGVGFGLTGKAYYGITENGDITGTLGFLRFGMKENIAEMKGRMLMIPIMAGYRHKFGDFYGEPQLGLHHLSSKVKYENDMGLGLSRLSGTHTTTKVSLGLGGGYLYGEKWDFGARFQIVDNVNFFAIRAGYNISF